MIVEKIATKIAIMILLVLLILGAEKLYDKYHLPLPIGPAIDAHMAFDPVGGGALLAVSAATIGSMLIDCSCVENPPTERFIFRNVGYRCARQEFERLAALKCFECIIHNGQCPWGGPLPPETPDKERRDKAVQEQVFKEVVAAQNAEPIASVP